MPFPDNKEDLTVFVDDLTDQMVRQNPAKKKKHADLGRVFLHTGNACLEFTQKTLSPISLLTVCRVHLTLLFVVSLLGTSFCHNELVHHVQA